MFKILRAVNKHRSKRRGVAAVEFAVIAPLLLLLAFMMIESSRYLTAIHATTGAAREAVRMTAITGASSSDVTQQAKAFMTQSGFKSDSVSVVVSSNNASVPGMLSYTATVLINYGDVSVIGDPFNFSISQVKGYSSMLVPE